MTRYYRFILYHVIIRLSINREQLKYICVVITFGDMKLLTFLMLLFILADCLPTFIFGKFILVLCSNILNTPGVGFSSDAALRFAGFSEVR